MDNITKKVREEIERGWIGPNTDCEYHPCHFADQDCTFCYCPFYPCLDEDFGRTIASKRGKDIWDCSPCLFIHRQEVGKFVMDEIKRMGLTDPKDPRMKNIFKEVKAKYYKKGKALMIFGATSDAGKSVTVMAICRILRNRGFLVAPFKSQNMSLNSKVTRKGTEIAMAQAIQSKAAGLKNSDHHMNPILLKPKGDAVSQVTVEGKLYGDQTTREYYDEFIPRQGKEIVERNIDFLKKRYDWVIMEGAGSPAEINIYDRDIANMGAAKIAEAPCILVVNLEWGGSFAYAVGTVRLIPEEDRKYIKGIILNNVRGDPSKVRTGAEELEKIIGIPVIGIIPHIGISLPSEDSEALRGIRTIGNGKMQISVIRLPRIANFTDLDPLLLEDVTLRFVTEPEDLEGSDAVIIPGTKTTINDLIWMRERGIENALRDLKGKIPIIGICGGYQMMGRSLEDPNGIEGRISDPVQGMGFFDNTTKWDKGSNKVSMNEGTLIRTGEGVTGYETHMGISEVKEEPLFSIKKITGNEIEGSFREEEMLFGTYLHGIFERTSFRRFFLSFVRGGSALDDTESKDYNEFLEENLDKLASGFEDNMDIDKLMEIMEKGI